MCLSTPPAPVSDDKPGAVSIVVSAAGSSQGKVFNLAGAAVSSPQANLISLEAHKVGRQTRWRAGGSQRQVIGRLPEGFWQASGRPLKGSWTTSGRPLAKAQSDLADSRTARVDLLS